MAERLLSIVSGGGTTMEQNWIGMDQGRITGYEYAGAIGTNNGDARVALGKALELGIPHSMADQERFREGRRINRGKYSLLLNRQIESFKPTIIMLNGADIRIPDETLEEFGEIMYNQHPGWPADTPNVKGLQPHHMMLEYIRETGRNEGTSVVVHKVTTVIDGGQIVGYLDVPIFGNDTPETLQKRAMPSEYRLQESVLNQFRDRSLPNIPNVPRRLRPGELQLIAQAQKNARSAYPNG